LHSKHTVSAGYHFSKDICAHHHAVHTEHVITLVERGNLRIKHGEEIRITPGMLILVPAGVPHSTLEGENVGVWWLGFCTGCLNLDESHSLMAPFQQIRLGALPVFELPEDRREYFIGLMKELINESGLSKPDSFDVVKSLLTLILYEVKKASQMEAQLFVGKSSIISKALEFIQKQSLNSISLKDVAEAIHRSPAYLATTMKKGTGYSVGEWIARSRLAEACSRLLHTNEQVDNIAIQVGWNDVTHFIRKFKKAYGITPAAWRKKNKTLQIKSD